MYTNQSHPARHLKSGFTLIEVMIAVAIIGILAAIALPNYRDYVLRGKLVDATNNLATTRAAMEQYYQDNRAYSITAASSPCLPANLALLKDFTLSCTLPTALTYLITASGKAGGPTAGFTYTVDNLNAMTTTVGASWGGGASLCWIMRKGATC